MTAVLLAFILKELNEELSRERRATVPKLRIGPFDWVADDRDELDIRIDDLHCESALLSDVVLSSGVLRRLLDQQLVVSCSRESRSVDLPVTIQRCEVAGLVRHDDVVEHGFFVEVTRLVCAESC